MIQHYNMCVLWGSALKRRRLDYLHFIGGFRGPHHLFSHSLGLNCLTQKNTQCLFDQEDRMFDSNLV